MQLDKRIKNKMGIHDCFDTIAAKDYVDKNGYFTNNFPDFADLNKTKYGTLTGFASNNYPEKPYYSDDVENYAYFLPEEYVKQEKVFRPYTLDEFDLHIGDLIKFRRKDNHNFEICTMYMGYRKNGGVKVLLGNVYYSLKELFEDYEWYDSDSNTWEIFGVEEE